MEQEVQYRTRSYEFENCKATVYIPIRTAEEEAAQQKRIERALEEFWREEWRRERAAK